MQEYYEKLLAEDEDEKVEPAERPKGVRDAGAVAEDPAGPEAAATAQGAAEPLAGHDGLAKLAAATVSEGLVVVVEQQRVKVAEEQWARGEVAKMEQIRRLRARLREQQKELRAQSKRKAKQAELDAQFAPTAGARREGAPHRRRRAPSA